VYVAWPEVTRLGVGGGTHHGDQNHTKEGGDESAATVMGATKLATPWSELASRFVL